MNATAENGHSPSWEPGAQGGDGRQDAVPAGANLIDAGPVVELLSFTMGEEKFAVGIKAVREIRGWSKPTPLPNAQPYVRGVVNLRGLVLPILDLSALIDGTDTEENESSVVIVVERGAHSVGFVVDSVSDILNLRPEDFRDAPTRKDQSTGSFITRLGIVEGEIIKILDVDAVFESSATGGEIGQ